MFASLRSSTSAVIATAALASATVLATAPSASAVSASCTAVKQTDSQVGLDAHRARVICSSIASDTKVRAKLVRNGAVDYTSSWFTTKGKYYYTAWASCYAGCHATYEVARR